MDSFSNEEFSNTISLLDSVSGVRKLAKDVKEYSPQVPKRYLRDAINPLEQFTDKEFKANYAFSKEGFIFVFNIFKDELTSSGNGGLPIPPILKMSTFLLYLRSNGFYRCDKFQLILRNRAKFATIFFIIQECCNPNVCPDVSIYSRTSCEQCC